MYIPLFIMVKKDNEMVKRDHHIIGFIPENWRCLNVYCIYEKTNPTILINKLINEFLKDKENKMSAHLAQHKKDVEVRNGNGSH